LTGDPTFEPRDRPSGLRPFTRILYAIAGAWTDEWWDNPGAWWQWCRAFKSWSAEEWRAFHTRWRTAPERKRRQLMEQTGLWFFDWRRVPGGSLWGSSRAAAELIRQDLDQLPPDSDVTLLGHSKGGHAIKHLLSSTRQWSGARPARAIFVDAPLDRLREWASRLMRLNTESCRLDAATCPIPLATVNNWLDPSGGRLKGVPNYQTFVWQDYLVPYPPHGMKGFLAERVLRDLGALPSAATGETTEHRRSRRCVSQGR